MRKKNYQSMKKLSEKPYHTTQNKDILEFQITLYNIIMRTKENKIANNIDVDENCT